MSEDQGADSSALEKQAGEAVGSEVDGPVSGPVAANPSTLTAERAPAKRLRCPRCGTKPDKGVTECPYCRVNIHSPEAELGTKVRGGAIKEFFRGLVYFPKGVYFLLSQPSLWKLAVIPTILNLVFLVLSFIGAYQLAGWLTKGLLEKAGKWEGLLWGKFMWALVKMLVVIADFLPFLVVPLIVAWLFSLFGKILFMPFMEMLSEKTETIYLEQLVRNNNAGADQEHVELGEEGFSWGRFSSDMIVGLLDAILLTFFQILAFIVLLPLHFIPVLGSILWFMIPGCFFASMDYTDMNFVRRRYDVAEKIGVWNRRRWRFLGFGFTFFVLIGIPWVNIITGSILIPTACIGGTLLFLELDDKS